MKLSIELSDDWIHRLMTVTGTDAKKVLEDSVTMWGWAVRECLRGRAILSVKLDGTDAMRLDMETLNSLKPFVEPPEPGAEPLGPVS